MEYLINSLTDFFNLIEFKRNKDTALKVKKWEVEENKRKTSGNYRYITADVNALFSSTEQFEKLWTPKIDKELNRRFVVEDFRYIKETNILELDLKIRIAVV